MFTHSFRSIGLLTTCVVIALGLQACNQSSTPEKKVEIKPAPKMSNDATTMANKAWVLLNQVDPIVYAKQSARFESEVRKPLRELSIKWRVEVKMTDSVTEGKYALCRKALTSLDVFAREVADNGSKIAEKQADYERDKAQCKDAISHPELGNTDPKKIK